MKMYVATIPGAALKVKSSTAYYARQKHLFVLVVIMISVVPLLVISWTSSHYYQASWLQKTAAELKSMADSRKEIINLFLENQENLLASYAELYDIEQLRSEAMLEQVFTAINRSGVITDLGVIDLRGNHLAYVGPYREKLADKNYVQAEWFAEVMRNNRYVSDVFTGYRGVPHFVVAVTSPSQSYVLRATINSALFNALLNSADVGPGGDAFIVNRQGALQTPSRRGIEVLPAAELAFSLAEPATRVRNADQALSASANLKGGDWMLVLKTDIQTSLAEYYQARNRDLYLIAAAGLMILVVATLLVRSMVNQIENADRQRTNVNDRMRQVEKMALIGRLAASVAHEVNNPLQIIGDQAGWMDELLDEEDPAQVKNFSEYRQSITKIRGHVKRASAITHRLLGFSRGSDSERTSTNLNVLVEETVSFLENEAKNQRIVVRRNLAPALPAVITDAAQLQQVFLNILNNAMDAIGADGAITISTSPVDGRVVVEFADSGPGLQTAELKKIFDPFFTTKQKGKGTGLGLSISYNIMQRLGGDIQARNGNHGGSVFSVALPAA